LLSPDAVPGLQTNAVKYFETWAMTRTSLKKLNRLSWTGPTRCAKKLTQLFFVRTLSNLHQIY